MIDWDTGDINLFRRLKAAQQYLRQQLEELKSDETPIGFYCQWNQNGTHWQAACGAAWEFEEGEMPGEYMKFCPECGRPLLATAETAETEGEPE